MYSTKKWVAYALFTITVGYLLLLSELAVNVRTMSVTPAALNAIRFISNFLGLVAVSIGLVIARRWIRLEEELRKANLELETCVAARTSELTQAKELAEAANRAKSEFIANMSHELHTPLNSIIGFSEVLADQSFGPLNEKQKRYVDNVLDSGRQLLFLIESILDMTRMNGREDVLSYSVFPFADLIKSGHFLIKEKALKHGIDVAFNIAEDIGEIEADITKIKKVIFNLLSNAVKFTPDGGKLFVGAVNKGAEIEVAVTDSGIGIRREDFDSIFRPFSRLETALTKKYPGAGLGLSVARKIVEAHGGRVWVESEGEGKGSTFKFTLPVKRK